MEIQKPNWLSIYAGVALTTMATLIIELGLTRIFSVVFYYHFAFLAISIALFGLGAGGVLSYLVAGWRGTLFEKLGWIAALNAGLVLVALVVALSGTGEPGYWRLGLVYFSSALPFLGAGIVVSLVISETIERVNRVYFADLLGAAGGCLLLIPLLDMLGGPNSVIAAAALYAISAVIWFGLAGARTGRMLAGGLAVGMAALMIANHGWIDIHSAKGKALDKERFVMWNSFSRVGVEGNRGSGMIYIDADASTGIPAFDFSRLSSEERSALLSQGPGLPYAFKPGSKTLIIGAGGGYDVARALASGSRDVTGVEINPIIANTVMRERLRDLSLDLYHRPEVRIVVEDGRSFVRRTPERYQIIQATLVDTWASTAAGAFALSENNLYTTDAFRDYLDHLTDDGLLVFTRWGLEPPRESLRLLSLATAALRSLGEREPSQHVLAVREGHITDLGGWGAQDTVFITRKPLRAADLARFRQVCNGKFEYLYLPDEQIPNPFTELMRSRNAGAFERAYPYDISPVGDDRPFFFYTVQPRDIWSFVENASRGNADFKINKAVPVLYGLFIISLLATAAILVLPRVVLRSRFPRGKGVVRFLWYFIFLGAGYILIQVALVQKFVLLLGHPTYALTVIIFSMLISSGLGSYASTRIARDSDKRLEIVLAAVAAVIAVLAFSVAPLITAAEALPLGLKFVLSVVIIAPAGFLMGMPFPSGLRRLETRRKEAVRWAWSLNAAASVLGSVGAIVLAIYIGLRDTLLVGGAMYVAALVAVRLTRQQEAPEPMAIEVPVS